MRNNLIPEHIKRFFEMGGDFNRHQDPGKFKMQLGALEKEVKINKNKRGITFIKKQKKLMRF